MWPRQPSDISVAERSRNSANQVRHRDKNSVSHSHSYGNVHILGANATVHLGDKYGHEQNEGRIQKEARGPPIASILDLIVTVFEFLSRTAPFLGSYAEIYVGLSCGDVDHSLIATALAAFRDATSSIRNRLLGTSDRYVLTKSDFAEVLLDSAASKAVRLSEALEIQLEALLLHGVGKKFTGFQGALTSIVPPDQMISYRVDLHSFCEVLTLGIAVLLSSRTRTTGMRADARHSQHKPLISALLLLEEDMRLPLAEINLLFLPKQPPIPSSEKFRDLEEWFLRHKDFMIPLLDEVEQVLTLSRVQRIRKSILDGLSFPEMDARYHEIPEAQSATFKWIYETEGNEDRPPVPFADWLQSDESKNGLFWVSGKPGSGKSTLMRFLADDSRTRALAEKWAGPDLLIIKSFFWNPGTWLQKSQQGLLRSILYQLLRMQPEFAHNVFPRFWSHLELSKRYVIDYNTSELESAIFAAVADISTRSKMLLIVDGLDEYHAKEKGHGHEERQAICDLLHQIASQPGVKVCTSSRPWNVYRNSFRENQTLRLEELTKQDIRKFIQDTFRASSHFNQWVAESPEESTAFVEEFIRRAQGVFLWVCLVAKSLLKGLQNWDDLEDLTRRLEKIPTDLDKYFLQIISSLDDDYLEQASHFFKVALSGPPHLLMLYHFVGSRAVQKALSSRPDLYTLQTVLAAQKKEEIRVNARCMGFLEPIDAEAIDYNHKPGVQALDFLHRTARDFMLSDKMQQRMNTWEISKAFNVEYERLQGMLCLLRSSAKKSSWLNKHIRDKLVEEAMQLTSNTHVRDKNIWQLITEIQIAYIEFEDVLVDKRFILIQALTEHHPYAVYVLSTWSKLPRATNQPWLDMALNSDKAFTDCEDGLSYWHDTSLSIIERLLALGANPNEVCGNETVWTKFLERNLAAKGRCHTFKASTTVLKLLIRAGAISAVHTGNYIRHGGMPSAFGRTVKGPDPYAAMEKLFSGRKAEQLHAVLDRCEQGRQKKNKSKGLFSLR